LAKYRFLKVIVDLSFVVVTCTYKLSLLVFFCLMRAMQYLQKQSELLLNADDLDAMWVCLRENCVIDDATGAENNEKVECLIFLALLLHPRC
jgi:hypothetical protein